MNNTKTDDNQLDENKTQENEINNTKVLDKKKVLIVDDEDDARELFVELLSTVPEYEVFDAKDGTEALKLSEENKFDLILLDIIMPNKDGVDTLSDLKSDKVKYGNPKIIMLTNIGGDVAIEKAIELGAMGYLLKIDTEPEGLLKAVADALLKSDTKDNQILNNIPGENMSRADRV